MLTYRRFLALFAAGFVLSCLGNREEAVAGITLPPRIPKIRLAIPANVFTHTRLRTVVASDGLPFRMFGNLVRTINGNSGCTAFLAGERLIVTNAHCVYNSENGVLLAKQFFFVVNPKGDEYSAETVAAKLVASGWTGNTSRESKSDWAILELESHLGLELGYFGFEDYDSKKLAGFSGIRQRPVALPEESFCDATDSPIRWFREKYESMVEGASQQLFLNPSVFSERPLLCSAGYSADLGKFNLSAANACGLVGWVNGQFLHDCPGTRGGSGSPIFYRERQRGDFIVVALDRGEYRPGDKSLLNVPLNPQNANLAIGTNRFNSTLERLRKEHAAKYTLPSAEEGVR